MRIHNDTESWGADCQMTLVDADGRVGIVSEYRDYSRQPGVFARPQEMAYQEPGNLPGVGSVTLITPTWWTRMPDGTYEGLWCDDPADTRRTAKLTIVSGDWHKSNA